MKKSGTKSAAPAAGGEGLLPPILIALVAFLLYARTIGFEFVYDDLEHILNNPVVLNFTPSQFWHLLWQPWRSLPYISYGFSHYIFGFNPGLFHLTNVLIHALNSVLVYGIARMLAKKWLPADKVPIFSVSAAMIFAVHPLHSEAVAYVWARSSSLCALFYFGSLLMLLAGLSGADRKRILYFGGALITGLLAWKTKEESLTLPLVWAAMAVLVGSWRIAASIVFLPLVAVASQWHSLVELRSTMAENPILAAGGLERALDPVHYFLTSLKGVVFYYLRLYVLPVGQNADPYLKPVTGLPDPWFLLAIAILAGLVFWGFAMRSHRMLVFGLAALLISPLTAYAVMPLPDILAERRVYIAGLGVALIAGWLITRMPRYRYAALAGIAVVLGSVSFVRAGVWADSLTLWRDAEEKSPELARPHLNLGMAYQTSRDYDRAIAEYRHALRVSPRLSAAYVNMAGVYFDRGDLAESERALKRALELAPSMPAPYLNLAQIEMKRNNPEEALKILNRMPESEDSYLLCLTKGDVYAQLGRYPEAAAEYESAVRLRPDLAAVVEMVRTRLESLKKTGRDIVKTNY